MGGEGEGRLIVRAVTEALPEVRFGLLNRIGYACLRAFAWALFLPWFRLSARFDAPMPRGPVVFAPNHRSLLDPIVVQVACPRRLVYLITDKWYSRPQVRWFFRFMRCIPVEQGVRNRAALDRARAALEAGHAVAIFPEGRISADGRLGEFVPGVVALARRAGAPIVPVAITGTREALPRGAIVPRPAKITVRFGAPYSVGSSEELDAAESSRRVQLREDSARLRGEVAALLPEPLRPAPIAATGQSANPT